MADESTPPFDRVDYERRAFENDIEPGSLNDEELRNAVDEVEAQSQDDSSADEAPQDSESAPEESSSDEQPSQDESAPDDGGNPPTSADQASQQDSGSADGGSPAPSL